MCLRIETLLKRFRYFSALKGDWGSYSALLGALEITSLLERGDLKQELIKELERQHSALKSLSAHDGVDKSKLDLILSKQKHAIGRMHQLGGKLGEHLKRVDFLSGLKQRTSIPGGSCDFDLPSLRFWLNQNHQHRLEDLLRWTAPYLELESVIELVLGTIRDSATGKPAVAENGFFHESLDPALSYQLLRIGIPIDSEYYPEISAGKHRYSVRFLQPRSSDDPPSQVKQDIPFILSCCSL